MSSIIKINLKSVINQNKDIKSQHEKAKKVKSEVQSIRSKVDSKILSRRNINGNFSNASSQLQEVESDLKKLNQFIINSMDRYEKAEKNVQKLTDKFQDKNPILRMLEQAWEIGGKVFSVAFPLLSKAKDLVGHYQKIVAFKKDGKSIFAKFNFDEMKKAAIDKMTQFVDAVPDYLRNSVNKFTDAIVRSPQYIYLKSKIDSLGKFTDKLMDKINTKFIQPIKNISFTKLIGEKRIESMKQKLKSINTGFTKLKGNVTQKLDAFVHNKNVAKFFKAVSGIDDGMKIFNSFKDNFRDGNKWTFGPSNFINFTKDVVIDLALPKLIARGLIVATGPVGIGASIIIVGGVGFALEYEYGKPKKSALDRTKEFFNIGSADANNRKKVKASQPLSSEVYIVGAGNLSKALCY